MTIIKNILAVLGIVFLILILLIVIFIISKPYGIDTIKIISILLDKNPTSSYDHPNLTTQQESVLESVGIDPKKLPTEITPELQKCATPKKGKKRANEIMSGSMPTIDEILRIKICF